MRYGNCMGNLIFTLLVSWLASKAYKIHLEFKNPLFTKLSFLAVPKSVNPELKT